MRQILTVFIFVAAFLGGIQPATADCLVKSKLDQMHQVQTRMMRNPNALFFGDDIRRLRLLSDGMGTPEVLRAVAGNRWVGHGAVFRQFLDNNNRLLARVSLDDPQSVRPHFDIRAQQNLQDIGNLMNGLRCSTAQINSARVAASLPQTGLPQASTELVPPALIIAAIMLIGIVILRIAWGAHPVQHRERAKRFGLKYATRLWWNNNTNTAMLLDINRYGTRLRHKAGKPLPPGVDLNIAMQDGWTTGTIVWSDSTDSGVRFKDGISQSTVGKLRDRASRSNAMAKSKASIPKDTI
ncbi:hypothetical protein [Loktanella sp. Alg231-35]|uniref:hypothetical protein n=1 Tax=Loktanella sp. Alg231-35 TaxID=1922220 RepID=UPI000D55D3A5|nr:hypothetical protein [Loktanella sp. Alg231-35]